MIATSVSAVLATALRLVALASVQDLVVTSPDFYVPVEPGQHADIPLVFTNQGDEASSEALFVITASGASYTYEQRSQPECGPIGPSSIAPTWQEFTVAPIPAGGTLTCIVRVDRPADAIDNVSIDWFIEETNSWIFFAVGTFADIGISATRLDSSFEPNGTIHATYRLDASNSGVVDVDDAFVLLGPTCVPSPIVVDMNFPGGCVADEVGCGFGGGPGPAARLSVLAGQSTSCLVRFTAPPDVDTHVNIYRTGGMINHATGGYIADDDIGNDSFALDLGGGAPIPASTPALSLWSMLILVLTLAAIAFGMRRRARV